jgi:hypothetical protein
MAAIAAPHRTFVLPAAAWSSRANAANAIRAQALDTGYEFAIVRTERDAARGERLDMRCRRERCRGRLMIVRRPGQRMLTLERRLSRLEHTCTRPPLVRARRAMLRQMALLVRVERDRIAPFVRALGARVSPSTLARLRDDLAAIVATDPALPASASASTSL